MGAIAHRAANGQVHPDDREDDPGDPAGGQAESSIAVDTTGRHIVIGFNDVSGFRQNPISISGFMYSDDGGQTFSRGGLLPTTTGSSVIGSTAYPQIFGDPEVKYLGGSNFIYFSIIVINSGASGTSQTIGFHRSSDFGHTWTGPFEISPATNPNGLLNGLSVEAADKEFADVNSSNGRVLMSWSNFTPFAPGGVEISTTFSDDIMDAVPVWSARSVVAADVSDGQASIPRFAGNGSPNVYLAWRRFPETNTNNIGFARSTDYGATWSSPANTASDFFTVDEVPGNDAVNTSPAIAVDKSSSQRKGNVYLVYTDNDLKDGGDIVFQRSTDGGLTFTTPARTVSNPTGAINSRPGHDRAQWFPWVTVDSSSGRVYVFYYDQGIDTSGDLTQTMYQFSDDGGITWQPPMPLSDRPFKAGWGNDLGRPNLGDYNQAVAQQGQLYASWAATQLLSFTNGLPSASMATPQVVFKRVPGDSVKVSLTSNFIGTTFTDGNGNGFIDAGEQVRFKLPLTNYVTNPVLNPTPITGIVATLSANAPTVTIVQGTSGYPTIAPGASATNATDFVVQISPSYVRGTSLDLVLNITSNQGSVTLPFTRATGTPLATTIFQENFDSTPAGSLPEGWLTQHVGGNNTVMWTTSRFHGLNNGAFHINAADGLAHDSTRWERLLSPLIQVPQDSEYVTLDFDVRYNTQDDPAFNILAYDGFLLRVADYGSTSVPPSVQRAVLAEAFDEEFTTGSLQHLPKHLPREDNDAYLQDMSAWAGDSAGLQHVHMKLNGMAGRNIRLWWEYTQDASLTCKDVRPSAPACGVLFDNLVVNSVVTLQADLSITKSITSGPAVSGQNITYRIDTTNNGPTTNVGATVTDDLPPLLGFVSCSATAGGACTGTDNHQTITLPSQASGSSTVTLVAAVSCSAAGGTPLSNTATVSSSAPDPDTSNNYSTAVTAIVNPLPVMSCPADILTTAQPGQSSAIANFALTATDNCPLPAGAIIAKPASGSAFPVGTTKVTATVTDSGGDQSSCGFNVSVNAPTSTSVKSITAQSGDAVVLTASVTPTPLGPQNATGTVSFLVNGNTVGSAALNAAGVAALPYTIVQVPGTYPITANYVSSSPFFLDSSGSGQLTVGKANQTITFAALPNHVYGDPPFALSATSSSGLTVTFTVAGNCSLSGNVLTINGAGGCTITASQPGDTTYNAANPVVQSFTISKAIAVLNLTNLNQTYDGKPKPVGVITIPAAITGVTVTYDGSLIVPVHAGSYAVVASLTNVNYQAQNAGGTLIIAAPTTTGSDVIVSFTVGSTTITTKFDKVSSAGTTSVTSIDPAAAGMLPGGFATSQTKLAFDLTTTASYSGEITTCFMLSSIADLSQFQSPYPLRIMHRELINGAYMLVDRTILTGANAPHSNTRTICAETPSVSPFVFAKAVDFMPPKISDLTLSQNPARVGTTVVLKATSTDVNTGNSNIASMEYSIDGGETWRIIGQNYGLPAVTASVPLDLQTGVYSVCIRSIDAVQNSGSSCVPILAIYDPNGPFVTGSGWIPSGAGKIEFEFDAKYRKDATLPSGNTNIRLQAAGVRFQSSVYEWLVVSGNRAQIQGSGQINGKGDYRILLTAIDGKVRDGNRIDKVRIKIWNKADGTVIYDNAPTASDIESAVTALGGGNVTIHSPGDD